MKRLVQLATVALAVSSAQGSPLQHGDLPAEPAWLLHLDCDNLRQTVTGQFLLTEMEKPELKAKLEIFQSLFSFDPRHALHGLTLYGGGKAPEDGVLLLYADFEPAKLETLAKAANGYESSTHRQHTIHTWLDEKRRAKDGSRARNYAAIHGKRVVVFGQRASRVASALDVLDHTVAVLSATDPFVQFGNGANTSFLVGAARKLDFPGSDPNAAILRLSKVFRVQLGERQGQLNGLLCLEANNEEVAQNMASIGQGLVSLMKLQTDKAETAKLAEALALKQDGSAVNVSASLPAAEVVGWIKSKEHKKAEKAEK